MIFNSYAFLAFFPIVTLAYYLMPMRARRPWLLAASYYFYMCWNAQYALLIAASTLVTYLCALALGRMEAKAGRRAVLALGLAINLGILCFFKYFGFFTDTFARIAARLGVRMAIPAFDVLLPVGISFYTFQALGYMIDVYRGKLPPERSLMRYALFVSFFPQLVAGPIERSENLLRQVNDDHPLDEKAVRDGLLVMLLGSLQSCSSMFGGGVSNIMASSYLSQDSDMLAAEEAYCAKEDELREYLDTYEATHDYDEYHFDLDEIEHDPYVLVSILSALHEGVFTIDQVQGDLQTLFDKQYILTETVTTETRYRTETRTDSEGNEYEVEVPYTWYICTVTLENFDLSHVPVYMMGEEQLSLYATYMSTLGNRPDLFPSSGYVNKYIENPPTAWEIPAEYLTDERFNTLITEAEKYLGYPYVWGGSSPSTSFDCSGFVSYVLTNSGLCNTGRLGAQGLYNISTPVSDPQPGDLVFFVGTYDTPGVSHVGIYVGDNMMLHCGDPISYTNLNTSYWQSHLYSYGRPPYN